MARKRRQRGGFLGSLPLPGMNQKLLFDLMTHVVAPKVGQVGKSLQNRRRRRQRGGFIPGMGFAMHTTGRGGQSTYNALKKDEKFVGDLIKAYLLPQIRKRQRR